MASTCWIFGARLLHRIAFRWSHQNLMKRTHHLVSKPWAAGGTRTLGLHLPAPHLLRWTLREGKSVRGPCWGSGLILMRGSTMHDVVMGVAQGFGYCSSSWCSSCYTFHFSSSGLILVFSFHLTPREDPHHQTPLVLHLLVNHGLDFSFPTYFRSKPSQVQFLGLQGHSGQAKGGIPRVALRWLAGLPKRD